jgi:putative hemolysin
LKGLDQVGFIVGAVLLICLFVGATLFFSVNAIALRTFSRLRLQEAFKTPAGEEQPERVEAVVANSDRLILTCAFFRFAFNICGLLLLTALLSRSHDGSLRGTDYVLAFALALVVFSIFGLAIPHAWAKYAGEKLISRTYRMLMVLAVLIFPILYILRLYDGFVRRLAGVPQTTPEAQQEEKQEEFLEDLEQHRAEGVVDAEEQEMIENVLELSDSRVDEIMTPRTEMLAVDVNADLPTVLEAIRKEGHSRIPVYEESIDNIVGVVFAKDLLDEIGRSPEEFRLRDRMREAYFVPETKSLRALLREFQGQKLHMAVVLDEYGGTAGIITLEDILEELVGEITDEYEDMPAVSIRKIDENTIEVDARAYVDDLNDEFGLNLPEDADYDTIGGFVFSRLGYVPKAGEHFDYGNLTFTIASAEPRRVKRVRIQKMVQV